jgi:hypothetical protein
MRIKRIVPIVASIIFATAFMPGTLAAQPHSVAHHSGGQSDTSSRTLSAVGGNSARRATPLYDLTGTWTGSPPVAGDADHIIMDPSTGAITGASTFSGTSFTIGGSEDSSGNVTITFSCCGSYVSTHIGKVVDNGNCMSGTWKDTGGSGGAWASVRNGAVTVNGVCPSGLTVSGLSKNFGPASGGVPVTINGLGFTGATAVSFVPQDGDPAVPAASFSVVSDSAIAATPPDAGALTPPGPDGLPADILVTVGANTSTATSTDVYTFLPPTVNGLNKSGGPIGGNTKLVVTGSEFTGATIVRFKSTDGTTLGTVGVTASNDRTITVKTPDLTSKLPKGGKELVADVQVANHAFESKQVAVDQFTFSTLGVDSVTPNVGLMKGGDLLKIGGWGFSKGAKVTFVLANGKQAAASSTTVLSKTVLSVKSPSVVALVAKEKNDIVSDVIVKVKTTESAVSPNDQYTFSNLAVTGVTPNSGPLAGGNEVTVHGVGLTGVESVCFVGATDKPSCAFSHPGGTDTALKVTVPPAPDTGENPDVVDVLAILHNEEASPTNANDRYTYELKVTGVTPNSGPLAGGNVVTVHGVGLTGVDTVFFRGKVADTAAPHPGGTDTALVVTVPPAPDTGKNPDIVNVNVVVNDLGPDEVVSPDTPDDRYTYK